ncbi:MAG TPA: acyltransferase [Steroidobacteraceae bacterium]|nr:acyltransferase [Steroidobacteraceae bacterium]
MIEAASPSHEESGRPRLHGVDILRGLCVLLVIMHHIHLRFVINHYDVDGVLPKVLNQVLFWSGYYAVITFFVISGFLITSLSVGRWGPLGEIHVGSFYGMRAARILPCLLLALLVLSILHLAGIPEFTIKPERASLGRALWAALTFHVNWLEGRHGYLPGNWDVLWSLSVEEAFYLLFPLACLIFRREQVLLLPLLCLIIAGPVNRVLLADQDPWGDYAYLSCMDGVAFGCVAALACARQRLSKRTLRIALALGTTVSSLVIVLCNEDTHSGLSRFGLNVTVLEAGIAMMLLSFGSGVGNGALSRGTHWLRVIGRSSYEIYLFHMLVVLSLMGLFKRIQPPPTMIAMWYVGMLLLSVLLGCTMSSIYSEPLNRRLRSRGWSGHRDVRSPAAATYGPHR